MISTSIQADLSLLEVRTLAMSLDQIDRRNPPAEWPDYLPAPVPAEPTIWGSNPHRADNLYGADLMPNSCGGIHPVAALARAMQEMHWDMQLARSKVDPSMTVVQRKYADLYARWVDSRVQIRMAARRN